MEVYEIVIDDHNESGVDYIALVDEPAIMRNFMAFSKQENKMQFKAADEDKRIILGAAMIPDLKIERHSPERGKFFVFFSPDTIRQIAHKYHRNGFERNVNLMHDPNQTVQDVYFVGGFITDSKMGIKDPEGFDNPEGTWYVMMKVDNDELWNNFIKTGEFKGFSVEGLFAQVLVDEADESEIEDEILDMLKGEFITEDK